MDQAIAAARAAYEIEASCIREMLRYFDEDAFQRAVRMLAEAPRTFYQMWPPASAVYFMA